MATRHELIHIDFVANAGKANPVMKSLQVACDDARVAKEKLDKELANAKAAGAPAKVIADIEGRLKAQTKTWEALQKGMREYTKGIDTLSKGIKEFNQGTLDQMSAKFNKSVYNAAKLVQSTVETGSKYWNQLQRLMDATDRNVTRAKEDIVTMMQSLKDGSSVSTVQLTRAKEVLEDLSRLAVYNSEEWRNLKAQMNEVAQAVDMVAATERSLKGEIASEQDALRLSNALTQESINLRHADGEAAMQAAKKEREGIEATMKGLSDKKAQRSKELDDIRDEIELQEHLDEVIKKRDQKIADARSNKQDAEQKRDEADRTIKAYDEQKAKVGELKKQVDELTKEQGKEAKAAEKAAEKAEKHAEAVGKQQEKVSGLEKEVEKLEQDLDTLSKQPVKPTVDTSGVDDAKKKINQEPIKPKVDDSEVKALEARLKAIQDAIAEKRQQIEAESKKGAGSISQWEETLKRVQGSKDGRLTAMGLGDEKKQMDDLLDVANRFYEIIKKVKGVTEDKFIPAQAAEPIKQLAEYYQITEEEARKLIHTLERSDVVQKKFATMRFDEHTGFLAVEQKKGVDDQQIRIEAAQSYLEKAREREAGQTERINKLTGELNDLEQKEAEQKEKIAAASEKAAQAAEQQNEATDKKIKLSKKEQQEVEKLTQDNAALTSTIEALKKQRDALTASDEKGAEAAKKGAEAAKEEAQAMKMTAEEAKAALEEMRKMSTLKLKGDTGLEASNIEQAQQYLMGRIKAINPSGVGGGRFTLQGKNQIKDLIDAFKKDYGIGSDKEAREIVNRLVTGKNGGLIQRGVYDKEFGALQVTVDPEALKQRGARMLELTNISKGVTAATKEQTAADQAQEEEVKRLREAYRQEDETLRKRKEEYQKRLDKANAIGGPEEKDGKRTARGQALDDAETYRQRYVVKQEERTKAAWEEYQAVKSGTQATEANTKAKKDNVSVDQQKKQIDEQIAALEQQKAGNTERLTQLQEKGAKAAKKNAEATQEQTQAVKESADAEMTMEQLLKRRKDLDSKLAAKKEQLRKAQEELEKMTKSETAAEKEQSDVTARLTQKQAEYNEELQKMGPMKEARDQATKDRRNAQRVINRSDETINTTMREVLPERKSEEEMTQMRKKAEDLQKEINDLTQAFDQNAQAITNLNRKETEAAIEMAQSENVSIEKVKQAIELLKKKIETEATDAKTMQERGDAINRLSERLTQMNAEVAKLSQPIADRLKVDDLGTLSETEIRQGIEAAKQLIQTYKSGSDEANQLAERIVKAEKHLKDTGIEAARTAQSIQLMQDQLDKGDALTESALKAQVQYWQRLADDPKTAAESVDLYKQNIEKAKQLLDSMASAKVKETAETLLGDITTMKEGDLRNAINAAKEYQKTLVTGEEEHKKYSQAIIQAENRLQEFGLEAERARAKQEALDKQMRDRMTDLPKLSDDALQETKKYWEDMMRTQGLAEQKLSSYRIQLEKLTAEERRRKEVAAENVISNLNTSSDEEIKKAIQAFEQLRDAQAHGNDEWNYYNQRVQEGKKYLEEWARVDSVAKMEEQMAKLPQLSDAALTEAKKFWETMVAGTEKGSDDLREYEAQLERVKNEERERQQIANEMKVGILSSGSLNMYSEAEIREAINAAKELHSHMASAHPDAQKLAQAIAEAEAHIKTYGVEAARTAKRQKESDDMMRKQFQTMVNGMQRGIMPSAAAVKAQQNYWKKLIDDPKTAAESLQEYRDQLAEVEKMQDAMVEINGKTALEWFRTGMDKDASANKLKEMADYLKAYRDTLPKESNAAGIEQINYYLEKVGATAKKASEDVMSLEDALKLADGAGKDGFLASPQQIQQATKALNEQRDTIIKLIQNKKALGDSTEDEEEELADLTKKLRDLKHEQDNYNMSQEKMRMLMEAPTKAVNLEELKAAIKRADGELRRMEGSLGKNSKEYKAFAEQVKNAKNILKEMEGQAKATSSAWDKAWSRLKTYVGMYMGFNILWQKFTGTMGDMLELSDKMGEVRKTTGFTADEVGRLSDNLRKLDTRTTLTSLLTVSAKAGQLGLKTEEDVEGFTRAANMMMVALPEMGEEAATQMMKVAIATGEVKKIEEQMSQGLIDGSSATEVAMTKIASTIDQLRANSAAAAPQITDFVKRVGAVGAQSGISIDQVAALGATVDALGMRVEMSATALSRMIPAIKNNAFQIGALIGQTEEEILSKFENGMGMSVIVDIFETIRNNSKMATGDVEADAEQIEKAFEGAGLGEIMKELNQQGARAGIVFAGLSQNVEELKRNLYTAAEAYDENIAIQKEYDKMNETTAARWERLKNQLEESFVTDATQRRLGWLIDRLRDLIDLLTGDGSVSVALRAIIIYLGLVRLQLVSIAKGALVAVGGGLRNIGIMLGIIKGQMTAIQWGNIFVALAAAVYYAVKAFRAMGKEVGFIEKEMVKADRAVMDATEKMDRMFDKLDKTATALSRATEEVQHMKEGSDKLAEAQDKVTIATENHKKMIDAINLNYGQYLGFMLTEYDRAELIAAAHDKITAALKREMYTRQQQQSMQTIEDEYNPKILDKWTNTRTEMREKGVSGEVISETFEQIQNILENTKYNPNKGTYTFNSDAWNELAATLGEETVKNTRKLEDLIAQYMYKHLAGLTDLSIDDLVDITGVKGLKSTDQGVVPSRGAEYGFTTEGELGGSNIRQGLANVYTEFIQKRDEVADIFNASIGRWATKEREKSITLIDELKLKAETQLNTITTSKDQKEIDKAYQELANALLGLDNQIKILDSNVDAAIINSIKALADKANNSTDATKLTQARATALSIFARATAKGNKQGEGDGNNPRTPRGPYGNYNKRVDPYEQWDANALVKRRKEMLERVRALAGGADVQKVLSMDKKFMDDATRKGIKNMRDAIAWYNTERLKIQDELHNRNLTNEGMWQDPKKGRSRKPKTPESEAAIAELDRYYSERKERIEAARANEEMTEAEYNRRLDALEQEHLTKRSELRQTFTSNDKQFIQQFRKWWASVAELDDVSWETIEAEWKAAWERDRKYNNREAQKDLTAMQAIVVKQLHEIEAIIDKERPFNGITKNLQDNLTKMGILFKDGVDEKDYMKENTKRLTFLLKESENAYNLTFDQVAEDMRKNGLGAWADAIIGSENAEKEKRALIAQLHTVYDAVQDAIKREAAQVKKQVDITWSDAILPNGKSIKQTYEQAISGLGIDQGRVSRANSLIGAGQASERVADKLAIKQLQLQLSMQEHYFNLVRKTGLQRIEDLKREAAEKRKLGELDEAERLELDAKHATMSLNLSLAKEQVELDKQREDIIARTEESQNRLYTELKEWGNLLASSLQSIFEASNAGNADYYNERAKMDLTGKGGPGAGTYVVIDNAGTSDAQAHYEYLDERQALEREHEIEQQNAQAEAWSKVMDDINMKMSESITDWMNAFLQSQSVDLNTAALGANTAAINALTSAMGGVPAAEGSGDMGIGEDGVPNSIRRPEENNSGEAPTYKAPWQMTDEDIVKGQENMGLMWQSYTEQGTEAMMQMQENLAETPGITPPWQMTEESMQAGMENMQNAYQGMVDASNKATGQVLANQSKIQQGENQTDKKISSGAQSAFAKMTAAANLYGIAYQAMSNDNLDMAQKFEMIALQAVGNAAIAGLQVALSQGTAETAAKMPAAAAESTAQAGPFAGPILFAALSALVGGLMGLAASKVAKSKSQIASVTGASIGAGRMATGMLTYGEGNVNEFTDPSTLTPGRQYNVDSADGKTYRARYMGKNAKTHITNGPEFHLVGEKGREAIIDAHTTRQLQMDDNGIWQSIQTLYNGGRLSHSSMRRRGRGVRAFADGNLDEFEEVESTLGGGDSGMSMEQVISLKESIDRQSDLLEDLRTNGIKATFDVYGKGGLVDSYDTGKKNVTRHGERY